MTQRCPLAALAAVLWLATGCDRKPAAPTPPPGPALPPLHLQPLLPELKALAAQLPAPDASTQRDLRELAELALHLVEAEARTAGRAERALLDHPFAWWVLEPALGHEQLGARRRAAWLAGQSKQAILQLPLLLRLKYELDPETVVWVADALQRLGNDASLAWIEAAIVDANTAERAGPLAIEALRARGVTLGEQPTWDELRQGLQRQHAAWRQRGVTSLVDVPVPDPLQLQARLAAHLVTPEGWQLRPVDDAKWVMRHSGTLAVPMLCRALLTDQHYIRTMPLLVLADLGPAAAGAADAVLPLLGDAMSALYAVRTLGEIGQVRVAPFLRPLLSHLDTELRAAAAQSLGLLRDEPSREPLRAVLRNVQETADVRVSAAFGLACFGPDADADGYLAERAAQQDYHAPVLARLRERIELLRRP
jgi:hypothetical protein